MTRGPLLPQEPAGRALALCSLRPGPISTPAGDLPWRDGRVGQTHAYPNPAYIALACPTCGQVQRAPALTPGSAAECVRCGSIICERGRGSLEHTAALTLAAAVCFVPANAFPILRMNFHGVYSESTVWDGCVKLFEQGQWLVGAIVFLASMAIPLTKLLGLLYLTVAAKLGAKRGLQGRTWIYHSIKVIGPWAMLDVFLLAVLVALVRLEQIATVLPGPGLFAFTAVVVLTILASAAFDPKLIWERAELP